MTAGHAAVARLATLSREFAPDLGFVIHDNLEAVESEWRRFEDIADCELVLEGYVLSLIHI